MLASGLNDQWGLGVLTTLGAEHHVEISISSLLFSRVSYAAVHQHLCLEVQGHLGCSWSQSKLAFFLLKPAALRSLHSAWHHLDPPLRQEPGGHPSTRPLLPHLPLPCSLNLLLILSFHIPGHHAHLSNLADTALNQAFPSPAWTSLARTCLGVLCP